MFDAARTEKYDKAFLSENFMGPNAVRLIDEINQGVRLSSDMRILDLGCGTGLTSIFLAKEVRAQIFAVDLWISATDNFRRFQTTGTDGLAIPIHADATLGLPFADDYFDALVSIDSYHYYGNNDEFFEKKLKPFLKKGAPVAIAVPGTVIEHGGVIPVQLRPFLDEEGFATLHSMDWWTGILKKHLDDFSIGEMECAERAWADWLASDNPYAKQDVEMMAAGNDKILNLIAITGKVK